MQLSVTPRDIANFRYGLNLGEIPGQPVAVI